MKKLIQENGPDKIWVQTWQSGSGEEFEPSEPSELKELDDWTGQLFNYFFLSHFPNDKEGALDVNHDRFTELKPALDLYFQDGELGKIHAQVSGKWSEVSSSADEDSFWFTVSWDQFSVDEYSGRAIGFFFAREKNNFLNMHGADPMVLQGLPMKKPEFGCLIFPDQMDGFTTFMLDAAKADTGGTSWSKVLFPFHQITDDAFHAKQFFKMCKAFSEDVIVKEQQQPKEKQVSFLSDSLKYASDNRAVNFENFKTEVLKEPTVIDAFDSFQEKYSEERQWNPPDQFAVTESVQNQAKKFVKSVIKLDKNFHIYVHGNKERLEKGFDKDKKLHFYTLWFDAEA